MIILLTNLKLLLLHLVGCLYYYIMMHGHTNFKNHSFNFIYLFIFIYLYMSICYCVVDCLQVTDVFCASVLCVCFSNSPLNSRLLFLNKVFYYVASNCLDID